MLSLYEETSQQSFCQPLSPFCLGNFS
uniref:Uncharacterized protein n=1 Tax=Arundo donax TaxID=35708 RepID=A0A0A9ENU6_ARUDO